MNDFYGYLILMFLLFAYSAWRVDQILKKLNDRISDIEDKLNVS